MEDSEIRSRLQKIEAQQADLLEHVAMVRVSLDALMAWLHEREIAHGDPEQAEALTHVWNLRPTAAAALLRSRRERARGAGPIDRLRPGDN
jgi:hypothetical protein